VSKLGEPRFRQGKI